MSAAKNRHPTPPPKKKRGVVLLIVVSLLVLFVLMGITFAIVASKYRDSSWANAQVELTGDNLGTETDLVLAQILHDTAARTSLQYHSLLRDLYGDDGVNGMVAGVAVAKSVNIEQFYDTVNPSDYAQNLVQQSQIVTFFATGAFSQIPHYYSGRVITFTSGNATNHSSRIVDSYYNVANLSLNPPSPAFVFAIEAIGSDGPSLIQPSDGDEFLINGAPFNGAGAGYDPTTRNLDAVLFNRFGTIDPTNLVALLPHFAGYDMTWDRVADPADSFRHPRNVMAIDASNPGGPTMISANSVGVGGVDEGYDTPDYQNMALSMVPATAAISMANNLVSNGQTFNDDMPIIPSFHRPELINFWVNYIRKGILEPATVPGTNINEVLTQLRIIAFPYGPDRVRGTPDDSLAGSLTLGDLDRIYNLMHGCIFRPMPWDHPNFTGSNPNFPALNANADYFTLFTNAINSPWPPINPLLDPAITPGAPTIRPPFATGPLTPQQLAVLSFFPNRPVWDVDNDADGIPDSIWIDPGLPIITTKDGRRIKRLAAILVKDLDGSIDLNAHGSLGQFAANVIHPELTLKKHNSMSGPQFVTFNDVTLAPMPANIGLAPTNNLPRGQGYGPAEVRFVDMLGTGAQAQFAYAQLIAGRYVGPNNPLDGISDTYPIATNGDDRVDTRPGLPPMNPALPLASRDDLSWLKHFSTPNDYANIDGQNMATFPGSYASPPDVWGRSAVALDYAGQPVWGRAGNAKEMLDSPYEFSLSGQSKNTDSRYTPAQLERLLRYHDVDAMNLDDRILRLAGSAFYGSNPLAPGYQSYPYFTATGSEPPGQVGPSHPRRQLLAGMTSHIPAPATMVPQEMRTANFAALNAMGKNSILDVYRAKLRAPVPFGGNLPDDVARVEMLKIVPFEFFRGQKFDINRWLGNGVDDPGRDPLTGNMVAPNGIVDDPTEVGYEIVWPTTAAQGPLPPTQFPAYSPYASQAAPPPHLPVGALPSAGMDLDGDAKITYLDARLARQLYARHLFCLAMLFLPDNFRPECKHEDGTSGTNTLTPDQHRRLIIRRIAQWAINCVDFRDTDAVMTPFEFDYNPWDGWKVDGSLTTDGTPGAGRERIPILDAQAKPVFDMAGNPTFDQVENVDRGLVWGMEFPELLITETMGLHDRRIKDTDKDDGANPKKVEDSSATPDDDPDQFRVPQGSVFVELYCPRPISGLAHQRQLPPGELYAGGQLQLGLTRMCADNVRRPVWRLAFSPLLSDPIALDAANPSAPKTPWMMFATNRESASFDPAEANLLPTANPAIAPRGVLYPDQDSSDFDPHTGFRYAWFTNAAATNVAAPESNYIFSSMTNPNPVVRPGGYVVIGPRRNTYLGSFKPSNSNMMSNPPPAGEWGGNSTQYISLDNNTVQVYDLQDPSMAGTPSPPAGVLPPTSVICEMPVPWAGPLRSGLNITEPLPQSGNYYPQPPVLSPPLDPGFEDFYGDPDTMMAVAGDFPDQPLDERPNMPLKENNMLATRTYTNISAVYLQRLADPTQGFHPITNPYLTVDWSALDVSVFSGEEDTNRQVPSGTAMNLRTLDLTDPENANRNVYLRPRQRGADPTTGPTKTPWFPVTYLPTNAPTPGTVADAYFNYTLENSLPGQTLGYLNNTIANRSATYPDGPEDPFPWVAWNNRPFMNPMEMLDVPSSTPARFGSEITPGFPAAGTGPSPYIDTQTDAWAFRLPFGHLLNFFESDRWDPNPPVGPPGDARHAPHFYRLLDYLEVPSPYVGTENWLNPQPLAMVLDPSNGALPPQGVPPFANINVNNRYYFPPPYHVPPFNKVSRFRDPGRININTIFDNVKLGFDFQVWNSALAQFPNYSTSGFAERMFLSRQGDNGLTNIPNQTIPLYAINPASPTRFGNPFRSADSADLMPRLPAPLYTDPANNPVSLRKTRPVEATLLRPDVFNMAASPTPIVPDQQRPLFRQDESLTQNYNNSKDNPYFQYQLYQKMSNIFTTQSNCYAVWITIGYFEVEDNVVNVAGTNTPQIIYDAAHPDGLQLGQEVGGDVGNLSRHRAFYIIDRSIPVGFRPGSRLNTDHCILLRRLIE